MNNNLIERASEERMQRLARQHAEELAKNPLELLTELGMDLLGDECNEAITTESIMAAYDRMDFTFENEQDYE